MPAKISEATDDNIDAIEETASPKIRDRVVRVVPIESVHTDTDLVEDNPADKVEGGKETTYIQEEPDDTELQDIPINEVGKLIKAIRKRYGDRFVKWEPETLRAVLSDDLKEDVGDDLWQRILAARTYAVDGPWKKWPQFEKAAIAVTGGSVVPGNIQYISPQDLARALKVMRTSNPEGALDDEVLRYIAARLYHDNIMWTGDVFPDECQKYLYELGAPRPLVDACIERFKEVSALPLEKVSLKENLVDIQVGRILGIKHLLNS